MDTARRQVPQRAALAVALLVGLLGLAACESLRARLPVIGRSEGSGRVNELELRQQLGDFAAVFIGQIASTADEIEERSSSRSVDKSTLLWKVRMAPLMQDAVTHTDARIGFLRALGVATMQRQYLVEGDGRALFDTEQAFAADTARELEARALEVGASFLSPAEIERVRAQVEEAAARRPLRGREFDVRSAQLALSDPKVKGSLSWIVALPLAPFSALQGVSSGAAAIQEFNETAQAFSDVVAGLPEILRWEIELLLWDVEGRETVTQSLASLQLAAASAERVSLAAETLPENLRALLAESGESIAQANETIAASQELARSVAATAEQLRLASASWEKILARDGERDPDARPFDVREYEATARAVGAAAAQLDALTAELRGLAESQALPPALERTLASADGATRAWIDAAAWRALQLVVAFFALLVGYRMFSRWLDARGSKRAP